MRYLDIAIEAILCIGEARKILFYSNLSSKMWFLVLGMMRLSMVCACLIHLTSLLSYLFMMCSVL